MTKAEFLAEQKQKITDLIKGQEAIATKIEGIAKQPYVDFNTAVERAIEITKLVQLVKSIEVEKQHIASQPFPKFPPGGQNKNGLAVVGCGDTVCVNLNGKIIKGLPPKATFMVAVDKIKKV